MTGAGPCPLPASVSLFSKGDCGPGFRKSLSAAVQSLAVATVLLRLWPPSAARAPRGASPVGRSDSGAQPLVGPAAPLTAGTGPAVCHPGPPAAPQRHCQLRAREGRIRPTPRRPSLRRQVTNRETEARMEQRLWPSFKQLRAVSRVPSSWLSSDLPRHL